MHEQSTAVSAEVLTGFWLKLLQLSQQTHHTSVFHSYKKQQPNCTMAKLLTQYDEDNSQDIFFFKVNTLRNT